MNGTFFDSVPENGDLYLLRSVIHDWSDEKALIILRNCRRAMAAGVTLLLIEGLLEKGSYVELLDLHMMVLTGGRERSLSAFRTLLRQAGFKVVRVIRTPGPAIIESRAVAPLIPLE